MPSHEVDVCIVGGGPAGMLLANLLAARGLRTLVLEKAPDFEREFRGEVLQPRFMHAMAQVGLAEFVLEQPHERFDHAHFYNQGKQLGEFRFAQVDDRYPYAIWMTQPVMLNALHQRARSFPSFEIWFEARAHGLLEQGARTIGVQVVRGEQELEVHAKLVVGADGRFSSIAKLGAFELLYEHHPFDVLWFVIPRPPGAVNQVSFFISRDAGYLCVPKYPNLFQIGMAMPKGGFPRYRKHGLQALRDDIARAHPWFRAFAEQLHDFAQFNVLQAKLAYRREWARDGLLIIGDAAHTCSPLGAIGVSVAIETAVVAADVIGSLPAGARFDTATLARVQARRAADVLKLHRIQRFGGDMVATQNPVLRALRPVAVGAAGMLGLLPHIAGRLITRKRTL